MKAYLITTSTLFGVITVAHIARMIAESPRFARDPWYLSLTLLAAGLCAWGCLLVKRVPRG